VVLEGRTQITLSAFALFAVFAVLRPGTSRAASGPSLTGITPPGGGLGAVAAKLDFGARRLLVRGCAAQLCDPEGGAPTPIALADELDPQGSKIETIAVGGGRSALHVVARSKTRADVAWEAIVVPRPSLGAEVVWSGATGFGATGEGAGGRVKIEGNSIMVGELRRELTLCGQEETLVAPRRLDPSTLTMHFVAIERLTKAQREAAPTLAGKITEEEPIGSVLGLRGASTNDGGSAALVDGDPKTAWIETKKGDGRGEFVVFSSAKSTPIQRVSFIVRPTAGSPLTVEPPASLWLVLDDATYYVTLPKTEAPGARVDVVLPTPRPTTCLAIALERSYAPKGENPDVGLAEVEGVPLVPPTVHTLDDVVTLLDGSEAEADLARSLLVHAGAKGAKTLVAKLGAVGDRGKQRAVEVLESTPCEAAATGLVRLAWDAPKEVIEPARVALDACGANAKSAIAEAFAAGPVVAREVIAERYAKVDPKGALEAILAIVPATPASRRRTFRQALARVADKKEGRDAIAAWLSAHLAAGAEVPGEAEADPAIELGRAIAGLSFLREDVATRGLLTTALLARSGEGRPFAARYLAAEPLAVLATTGEDRALAFVRALFASDDRYLRARAAEVSANVVPLRPELVHALVDRDPRVRKSALDALRIAKATGVAEPAKSLLAGDSWTFVRVSAAELLGDIQGGSDVDAALGTATNDPAKSVRIAALRALGTRGARAQLPAVRARAFDDAEAVDVRREAVEALGVLCDLESADELFELAKGTGDNDAARMLGLAAIVALGELHPKDLAQRLSGIDQSSLVVKDAVRRALKTVPKCK
jgi:HEAT repeat protein